MKKVLSFLRSMRFGILLLVLVAVCSVIGSVIPQEHEAMWYVQNYEGAYAPILKLGLDHIFSSWYFIAILVMLCLNLILCSIVRIKTVVSSSRTERERAAKLPDTVRLTPEGMGKLRDHLAAMRCQSEKIGESEIFSKNSFGRYGSFLTHLSILLTVIVGAAALYLPQVTDQTCLPGESVMMPDGTEIHVYGFSIEDESGRLDFTSEIRIKLPDGRESETRQIRVNYPMSFGPYKVYQQTYGTAGSVTVKNPANGGEDDFTLTDTVFLSLDGVSGVWYQALYPDYLQDPSGNVTLISSVSGHYDNPVYEVIVAEGGQYRSLLAFPGDEIEAGGLVFRFNDPVEYPGLRIKRTPGAVNALLIAVFVLMTAALYITFFCDVVLVKLDAEGYAVGGPKPERMRVELGAEFEAYERKDKSE